jgi:Cu-Zn family superoxide dismutase
MSLIEKYLTNPEYIIIIIFAVLFIYYIIVKNITHSKSVDSKAIAVFFGKIAGTVKFTENISKQNVTIEIKLTGFEPNTIHGFHVHQAGDLSEQCKSMCAHWNPFNKKHGGIDSTERHVGDLGNIVADEKGNVNMIIVDNVIKLHGDTSIIGRGLIIHADEDDCGKGENEQSLITGNAGERIGCAVIGWSKENF